MIFTFIHIIYFINTLKGLFIQNLTFCLKVACHSLIIQCGWDYKIFHKPAVSIIQIVEYLIQNFKMHLKLVDEVKFKTMWIFSLRKAVRHKMYMPPIWKPKGIVLSNRLMVNKTKTLHNIERCQIERINIWTSDVMLDSANDYNHKC